ncbi:two-component system chemotaxis response regulator CheB [Fontibacillus phaseoli]|uniref:Protein-glutamate methylesterase/protein-glutamine glutaminase n=1 Tax=Fontibacillus phaseoli TaxID=1416533 RepID=A0A369BI95_9BACL|nr:chemotaxis response regulator protein-glutamate methylesterase [Fontibacillus phaseoli]RCX21289.1 two-component system chemotaxis response regulator CheB [Fontibacillus phaseoli]
MPYRVMVVDDSAFMRKIVSDLIEQDPEFRVNGTAKNGREAIEMIESFAPDLVTMDVEMPEMNGLEALKHIMERHPLPVIMLSGINEQGMRETIMALELGAFDFIRKPSASTSSHDIEQVGRELREQIRVAMLAKERRAARNAALQSKAPERLPPAPRKPSPLSSGNPGKPPTEGKSRKILESSLDRGSMAGRTKRNPLDKEIPDQRKTIELPAKGKPAVAEAKPEESRRRDKEAADRIAPSKARSVNGATSVARQGKQVDEPPARQTAELEHAARERERRPSRAGRANFTDLVAIGTSTGGPKALKAVLEKLPADFPAPIVIVQHMPPNFTKSLAQRLSSLSELTVVEAEEGMRLQAGTAYVAHGGYHLNVICDPDGGFKLSLSDGEPRNGHRPSVDVLYDSLLPLVTLNRHVVLLTGMGSDGAKSMKRLYEAGVTSTIAESEETCVVYGMPRSAIELGCVSQSLPLHEIGYRLAQVVK